MSGFQFTPDGIVPLGPPTASPITMVEAPKPKPVVKSVSAPSAAVADEKPMNVVKLARARLREIERELRRLKVLEKERDELRRLLSAATNKPLAVVREITAAKRG